MRSAAGNAWLIQQPMARVALRGKILRPLRRLRFAGFGEHSLLHRPRWVYGPQRIAIGARVVVMHDAWLAVEHAAWGRAEPVPRIGDGVAIRANFTVSAVESVVIEDDVLIAGSVTIVDSDHTVGGTSRHPLYTPLVTAPMRVGAGSWIGERASLLRGTRIGRGCVVAAGSVVRGEVPDGAVVAGVPARVVGTAAAQPKPR